MTAGRKDFAIGDIVYSHRGRHTCEVTHNPFMFEGVKSIGIRIMPDGVQSYRTPLTDVRLLAKGIYRKLKIA